MIYRLREIAAQLGVAPQWLRAAVERGDVPAVKIDGSWVIDEAAALSIQLRAGVLAEQGVLGEAA